MSLIGLLASTEKMVPEGRLHTRPFQFHLKEHWRFPQSLDTLLPWTETISAHLEWWQNPTNMMKGADLHPKDHSIQLFTDASNEGWDTHLEQASTKGLWSDREKRATHKCSRAEGSFSGSSKVQGPVSKPDSVGCYRQLNSSSLHEQTRRNPLGGDEHSPVEDHDLVPSLPDNIKSQTYSRVSECDGRPSVQVEPSAVNRMVTASTGVHTDLTQVVHSSCRSLCHSSEPQSSTVCISSPRPKYLGHRCSEHKMVGSHCLCSPSQGDPKNQTIQLPDHCNSPRLARNALVVGASAALNRDPTSTPSVSNSSQTVPQLCVSQQSTTSQPPCLVSGSGQLQEQGFFLEVAERIAVPQRSATRTIYKLKWALFEKWCRENSVNFSTLSVKQVSDFFMYLYQDLIRRPSTIDGYRTAIVDTLGPTGLHISRSSDLNRLLSSFHRDRPKSSRNLPKWNLSVVLNELTKAPFEPMKDTDLKHLTLKTAFLLALASGDYSCSNYHCR